MRLSFFRFLKALFTALFVGMLVLACNSTADRVSHTDSQDPDQNCRIVQHIKGQTCIPINLERVIILSDDVAANAIALGITPIAKSEVPGFPAPEYLQGRLDNIESIGSLYEPSLEKILQLKPDLILGVSYNHETIYDQLSAIAPTVIIYRPWPAIPWDETFAELAKVLEKQDIYDQLMADYQQRIEDLKSALGDRRLMMQVSIANTSSEDGLWWYGETHYSGSILVDVGLQRPPAQRGVFYSDNFSIEKIEDIDGDILFFVSWGRDDDIETLENLRQNPLWATLDVVQNDQVCYVGSHWHNNDIFAINAIIDDLFDCLVETEDP